MKCHIETHEVRKFCHLLTHTRPFLLQGMVEEDFGAVTLTV